MADERALLLSIRPRYAAAILRQEKTVELRRSRLHAPAGSRVMLYSSTPVKAVVGTATLSHIDEGAPEDLWPMARSHAAIGRTEYDQYFLGAPRAFALHLTDVRPLLEPVPLATLRAAFGVEPPQSFRYLTHAQATSLLGSAAAMCATAPRRVSSGRRHAWALAATRSVASVAAAVGHRAVRTTASLLHAR